MPQLIHFADLHAKARVWVGRPEIEGDAEFALRQIVDTALATGVDVLDAGDTMDSQRPDAGAVEMVQREVTRLCRGGSKYLYILGNHSMVHWQATSPDMQQLVCHLPTQGGAKFGDHFIGGIDYMTRDELQAFLPEIPPGVDIMVAHQRFREAFNWGAAHCSIGDFPETVRLILAGDIHSDFSAVNAKGQRLLYPGTPYLTSLDDTENSGVWLIDSEDLKVTRLPLLRRPIVRFNIASQADIEAAIAAVRQAYDRSLTQLLSSPDTEAFAASISQPIVDVKFIIDLVPGAGTTIAEAVRGFGHVFETPRDRKSEETRASLQFSQDVREVTMGMECGLTFHDWADFKEGDMVEAYEMIQINA